MDADLQRRPATAEPSLDSNAALLERIRAEITVSGPMPFARFMELALYDPDHGYYTTTPTRVGREGDFLTAPEAHPIFGAAITRLIADVWRRAGSPNPFTIREYGAGSGALAEAILSALASDRPDIAARVRYEAVEINDHRREQLVGRLTAVNAGVPFAVVDPATAATSVPVSAGFVLANEFLDAFPVHRVQQTDDGLREIYVDWQDGALAETVGPASTDALAERLSNEGVALEPGQRAEIALGLDGWLAEVGSWLVSGVVVIIDYGHPAAELYGPKRRSGTLLGYLGHRTVDDPLTAVGRQDLTAHVDFTAVERAARRVGLEPLGLTTQARFLLDLGLEDLLERARSDPGQRLGQYLELRAALLRLLDPRHTGGFRVLVLGRGFAASEPLPGMRRPAT